MYVQDKITEALQYGVVKMNIDTDIQVLYMYIYTRTQIFMYLDRAIQVCPFSFCYLFR